MNQATATRQANVVEFRRPPSEVELGATLPQLRVLAEEKRFATVFASRRFGKTTLGLLKIIKTAQTRNPFGLIWWVAPTYRQCRRPYRLLVQALRRSGLLAEVHRQDMTLRFVTGWRVEFRTAEIADNLRGEGINLLVVDEQGQIADDVWHECLRPALADTQGEYLGIGTPKGRRGFGYELFRRGQNGEPGFGSFTYTAYDACFIPRPEIEEARRTLPQRAFEQEFMAAFLDVIGVVFENVRRRPRLKPVHREPVGVGIDWAKKVDYTWFVAVGGKSGAVLDCQRVPQRLPYTRQVELACAFVKRWKEKAPSVSVVHDQTGVGEAIDDLMRGTPLDKITEGFVFSERSKKELVDEAIVDYESGRIGFVEGAELDPTYDMLIREHEDYSLEVGKTGRVSYGAPEGFHDDAVIATLLANKARRTVSRAPVAVVSSEFTDDMIATPSMFGQMPRITGGSY